MLRRGNCVPFLKELARTRVLGVMVKGYVDPVVIAITVKMIPLLPSSSALDTAGAQSCRPQVHSPCLQLGLDRGSLQFVNSLSNIRVRIPIGPSHWQLLYTLAICIHDQDLVDLA